jgi:hypothetical protein
MEDGIMAGPGRALQAACLLINDLLFIKLKLLFGRLNREKNKTARVILIFNLIY